MVVVRSCATHDAASLSVPSVNVGLRVRACAGNLKSMRLTTEQRISHLRTC
jgi:hypothetical protein